MRVVGARRRVGVAWTAAIAGFGPLRFGGRRIWRDQAAMAARKATGSGLLRSVRNQAR